MRDSFSNNGNNADEQIGWIGAGLAILLAWMSAQAGVELSVKRVLTLEIPQSIATAAGALVLRSTTNNCELSLNRIRRELEQPFEAVHEASMDRLMKYSCPFTRASRKNLIKRVAILTTAAAVLS